MKNDDQRDIDGDGKGDECDDDMDGDGKNSWRMFSKECSCANLRTRQVVSMQL